MVYWDNAATTKSKEGLAEEEVQRTIRISLSEDTTVADIDNVTGEKTYLSTMSVNH